MSELMNKELLIKLGLKERDFKVLNYVIDTINKNIKNNKENYDKLETIYIYGSKVKNLSTFFSDIDIAIISSENIKNIDKFKIYFDLSNYDMKYKKEKLPELDSHIYYSLNFKENKSIYINDIKNEGVIIWEKTITEE